VAVAVAAEAEPAIPVAAEAPRIFAASVADMFRAPALELRELATRKSLWEREDRRHCEECEDRWQCAERPQSQ
jgi:hypothetical protein